MGSERERLCPFVCGRKAKGKRNKDGQLVMHVKRARRRVRERERNREIENERERVRDGSS